MAATGVGAGDLITASLAGSSVGLAIVWAAAMGAVLKWYLNEGIARWQMATGTTLLEGWVERLGGWIRWLFLAYLLIWTIFTGGALVNACGVAGHALFGQLGADGKTSKILWGAIHSGAGLTLVLVGGFKLFERLMSLFIGVMFVAVLMTAVMIRPDWAAVGRSLLLPVFDLGALSSLLQHETAFILGLLGGVGGTVTMLSYGYWIREEGRGGESGLRSCRLDLGLGYLMTACFGVAMVIIGSRVDIASAGKGPTVAMTLAEQLRTVMGDFGFWLFVIGFWGAVFSSLLGVWQSVPYMFADFWSLHGGETAEARAERDFTRTTPYRTYLVGIALVSLPLLWLNLKQAQLAYAVLGSLFMPLLALTLLIMNNRPDWVGAFRNRWPTNVVLTATLLFFLFVAGHKAVQKMQQLMPERDETPASVRHVIEADKRRAALTHHLGRSV